VTRATTARAAPGNDATNAATLPALGLSALLAPPPAKRRRAVRWSGVLVVLAVIAALEAVRMAGFSVPNPTAVLLVPIAIAAVIGGPLPALLGAVISLVYLGLTLSSGRPLNFTLEDEVRIGFFALGAPLMALVVGLLRERADAANAVALNREQELVRALTASIQDGLSIVAADEARTMVDVNPRLCELTGYTREQLVGSSPPYPHWPADRAEAMDHDLERGLAGVSGESDTVFVRPDGGLVPVILSRSPLRDGRGRIVGVVTTIKDVTERRRSEEALRRSEEQLRQAQKMEAIGRFAGGIAHDFNNVLTAVGGFVELLLYDRPREAPDRMELEEIRRAVERGTGLTRQLLLFSRRNKLELGPVDLNDVIARIEPMLRRIIREDIELSSELRPDVSPVMADRGQLEQVILNLAVNARDAMPDGGRLTIETSAVEFDEAYSEAHLDLAPGDYVLVAVTDTGVGMSPEVQERIFEPFYTTKEGTQGTGLGLSTVYAIVTGAGGGIWVYSEPGRGTTFKVYLPRATADVEDVVARIEATPSTVGGKESVLVLEDDPAVLRVVRTTLERRGYDVTTATSADAARSLAERRHYDLVVTDVVMPGGGGPAAVAALREHQPDLPALFMSGYAEGALSGRGLPPDAALLEKPFTPDKIARRVREVLDEATRARSIGVAGGSDDEEQRRLDDVDSGNHEPRHDGHAGAEEPPRSG
jgi:PAS domain S-box-containing protein